MARCVSTTTRSAFSTLLISSTMLVVTSLVAIIASGSLCRCASCSTRSASASVFLSDTSFTVRRAVFTWAWCSLSRSVAEWYVSRLQICGYEYLPESEGIVATRNALLSGSGCGLIQGVLLSSRVLDVMIVKVQEKEQW